MIRRIARVFIVSLTLLVLISGVAYAAWEFYFPTHLRDTSGSGRTYYPALLGYGGQTLIDSGKIAASGLDTNMQVGTGNIEYMISTTNVLAVVPNLPAYGTVTANLYTGYTPNQTVFPVIVGENGYITTLDNAALEPANNFEFDIDGYWDNNYVAGKRAVYKQDAFEISSDLNDSVSARILTNTLIIEENTVGFGLAVWGATWRAQTFTSPTQYSNLSRIGIFLTAATGAPVGDFTVGIREVSAGVPIRGDYASITVNANTLSGAAWNYFNFNFDLKASTSYAIVIRHPTGDGGNHHNISATAGNPYAGGQWADSADSGASWVGVGTDDMRFRVYTSPKVNAGTNPFSDPSFESGTGSWYVEQQATRAQSIEQAYSGTNSLKIVATAATPVVSYDITTAPVGYDDYVGKTVKVAFWVWNASTNAGNQFIRIWDGGGTSDSINFAKNSQWTRYEATRSMRTTGTQFRINMRGSGMNVNDYFYVDMTDMPNAVTSDGEARIQAIGGSTTGYLLNFTANGANSAVNGGAIYNAAGKLWMSFWFNPSANWVAGMGYQYVFNKEIDANNYYTAYLENTGRLAFINRTGGVTRFSFVSTETSWTAGTWYHVIASMGQAVGGGAASDGARLRINNGVAQTNANMTAIVNGGNLLLGDYATATNDQQFTGQLRDWVVGTDDLTAAEETNLYNNSAPADATDYWYMDEGQGTTAYSYGSSANNGTAGAYTWWGTGTRANAFAIFSEGSFRDYDRLASVPANANDWYFMQGNSMSYADYIKEDVAVVEVLRYEPNTMLVATTLPDRDTADGTQNATITWGANTNLTVTYGAMESYEATAAESALTGGYSVPSAGLPSTWFAAGENLPNLPFYETFNMVSSETGMPVQTMYFVIVVGLAFLAFLIIVKETRSALAGSLALLLVLFIGSSQTIVPMWIPFSILLIQVGIMFLYRQVAY